VPPAGKRGHRDTGSEARCTRRVLFGVLLRQTAGFGESLLRRIGLDRAEPGARARRARPPFSA